MPPPLIPHWNGPVPKNQADADALKNSLMTHAYLANKGDIIIEPMPQAPEPVPGQKGELDNQYAPGDPQLRQTGNPVMGSAVRTGEMNKI